MTKVLIITNKSDLTSDFIVKRLRERKIFFYRFNTEEISKSCFLTFDFQRNLFILTDTILCHQFNLKEFTSVYFRRPELPNINTNDLSSGEIQFLKNEFYYTLEGLYKILKDLYWVSPIYAIREAENKIYQLELAKAIGFSIPDSIVTNIYNDSLEFYNRNDASCIVKPIKSAISYMPTATYELPYDGAKEMLLVEDVDNKKFLTGLFNAMYDELPAPKPKKKK